MNLLCQETKNQTEHLQVRNSSNLQEKKKEIGREKVLDCWVGIPSPAKKEWLFFLCFSADNKPTCKYDNKTSENCRDVIDVIVFIFSPKPWLRSLKAQSEYFNRCALLTSALWDKKVHLKFGSVPCSVRKAEILHGTLQSEVSNKRDRGKTIIIQNTYRAGEDYL